ncbi:hypothetical protein C8F04DRAFT_1263797 [Mycena alexandri]|uniref:CxC2-like cysteine cluster KDZ transposase-associated domain-containing protein n=1 Tax=Mycena alexandri TaxID=1745969 RepID=A0AAD6SQ47_9AGAR|nr:hypothetical protein C8F04DRAFT_1263797 [Mycena alexandri]
MASQDIVGLAGKQLIACRPKLRLEMPKHTAEKQATSESDDDDDDPPPLIGGLPITSGNDAPPWQRFNSNEALQALPTARRARVMRALKAERQGSMQKAERHGISRSFPGAGECRHSNGYVRRDTWQREFKRVVTGPNAACLVATLSFQDGWAGCVEIEVGFDERGVSHVTRTSLPALVLNGAAHPGGGAAVADGASDSLDLRGTLPVQSVGGGRGRAARGGRGKPPPRGTGEMHTHRPHVATTVERSTDGRHAIVTSTAVDTADVGVPAHFAEDVATAEAIESSDFRYFLGDDGRWAEGSRVDDDDDDGICMGLPTEESAPIVGNFERWDNADFPMKVFVEKFRDETLDEWLRSEGRGSAKFFQTCAECKAANPLFRCSRQTCFGPGMYCEMCIVKLHRQSPTHMIEKWTQGFFRPTTLDELGLRIQLGHAPGSYCPKATSAHKDFVLMDTLGIRTVKLNFCGCDSTVTHRQQLMRACLWPATSLDPQTCATFNAIRLFEVQNCLGKISAYDFVRSLELLSNADGLTPPPYRMMQAMKRAARGHDDSGVAGTGQGELALDCRMCPQPEKNLPEGWDKIEWDKMEEDQRYKYFLLLAADTNFKLINRNVSSEERDPVVDDGTGYFCNRADYTVHIRKHVNEEEISSCSGFQAMFLANAKRVKGLRVTGLGGVTCARHNMWRPNGIGDLQCGERYCNMDFLLFSAVLNFAVMWLILSYNIVCQFSKNVWTRMAGLPEKYHLKINKENVRWMVPNFHLPPHKKGCHSSFSFHWLWGAGCTHGETVEQNWEFLNGAAASTKLMGLGARVVALEGLLGFHNYRRLVSHRTLLQRRMAEDIKEGRSHQASFDALNDGMVARDAESVALWKKWVDKWEMNAHVENEENSPYEYTEKTTTLKDVRLKLAAEEYTRTADGTEVEREETPSTFIGMGLDLEEAQRHLAVYIKAAGLTASTTEQLETLKRRTQLRVRLHDKEPEETRLYMPSDIASRANREKACAPGLDGIEARLRMGEAEEALNGLRQGLRTRTATTKFKLKGHGEWEKKLKVLTEEDVRALNERALTAEEYAAREQLRAAGEVVEEGGIAALEDVVTGETHRTLSWIWYGSSDLEGQDEKLHEALRVEWCKAYSRSKRWREDLVLVEEEMRWTIEYGRWAEARWLTRATARTVALGTEKAISPEVVRAYALEHAERERRTWEALEEDWAPLRARAAQYLKGEDIRGQPELMIAVDRDALR